MDNMKKVPLGLVVIFVIMFFVAVATDIFWIAIFLGQSFPLSLHVDPSLYNAFAAPDILLSLFLYVGAYGLFRLKKYGFVVSLIAMGMWIFDNLLVFCITKLTQIDIVAPSLFFAFYAIVYLWKKRELFD